MNTVLMTEYFRNDVLVKRSYLRVEWCAEAIAHPLRREVQIEDGRIRHWIFVVDGPLSAGGYARRWCHSS